jgi:hypothetical protein
MATDDNIPNSNAPKNLGADGTPIYPSSYRFIGITLINKDGKSKDIQKIVTSLIIVEEIYSPLLTARIRIRDNENFFDEFKLSGQEIVRVELEYLSTDDPDSNKVVKYEFVVKDYPLFDKTTESINVQEYEINLVSSYAYLSRLQQISVSVVGNPITDGIKQIFKTYLGNPTFDYTGRDPCVTNDLKAVITQRTPLQAVEFLKGICYDAKFAPFFIYTTLRDSAETGTKIIARSWSDIVGANNELYYPTGNAQPYSLRPFEIEKPGTPEYLKEIKTKIIKFKSNIKLDKLSQAVNGGIGSVTEVVDLNERSYTEERTVSSQSKPRSVLEQVTPNFNLRERSGVIPEIGDNLFDELFLINRGSKTFERIQSFFDFQYLTRLEINGSPVDQNLIKTILDEPRTSREVYYIPVKPYGEGFRSSAEIKREALKDTKLYKANMDSTSHEIITYGDLNLKASAKIEIEIPKAVDTNEDTNLGFDRNLSGVYIIATSIHEFAGGVYTNQLKVIRESDPPSDQQLT